MIWVPPWEIIREGWDCEVLPTQVNVFFLPYFNLKIIFSPYAMILKWENDFSDRVNDLVSKWKKVPMLTTYGNSLQNGPEVKVYRFRILTNHMCKIHQNLAFLTDSSKKIERNNSFSHNDLGAFMRVYSTRLRFWGLIDTSKYFLSSMF